ncbi:MULTISPECIES: hypothetical protein, partial [unclassified Saccharothrix]|uniref:hypothetical protein n=1 Tax=unclassified Saccharothrix TaxID=2593673 RepID=UPI00307E9421
WLGVGGWRGASGAVPGGALGAGGSAQGGWRGGPAWWGATAGMAWLAWRVPALFGAAGEVSWRDVVGAGWPARHSGCGAARQA